MKTLILGIFSVLLLASPLYAANYDNPIQGTLKSVYADFITINIPSTFIKSPDTNTPADGDLSIKTEPSTAYVEFNQLSDLKEGDLVEVTYHEQIDPRVGNKKIAEKIRRIALAGTYQPETATTQTVVTTTTITHDHVVGD